MGIGTDVRYAFYNPPTQEWRSDGCETDFRNSNVSGK